MSQTKDALLRSYNNRLKDDVKSMLENFEEIIRMAKGENENGQLAKLTQSEQDGYEMQVRAANIVRAGESLLKLLSDIKQFLVLNDFHSVNDAISNSSAIYRNTQLDRDSKLMNLRDELAADLYDLELEYYTGNFTEASKN
ncbi:mediator of RNA polymerase II transcription subunit 22-like [Chironomus tepperi]|uniref:mediator of RNA polymerase II transcription subunit 22-like n=1 Tax=Chironomus tepperi TaxID=113505 RepID=UPI00391F7331